MNEADFCKITGMPHLFAVQIMYPTVSQILFRDFSIHVRCVGRCSCQGQVHLHRAALSIGITGWSVENLIDVLFHPQWRDSQALFENGTWNSHRTKWNLLHLIQDNCIFYTIWFFFLLISLSLSKCAKPLSESSVYN